MLKPGGVACMIGACAAGWERFPGCMPLLVTSQAAALCPPCLPRPAPPAGPVHPTHPLSRAMADLWMLFPTEEEYIRVGGWVGGVGSRG